MSDSLPPRPGLVESRLIPDQLLAGAAPQQLASSSWLWNGDMPTRVTRAAAVLGPMPGTVSRHRYASTPAGAPAIAASARAASSEHPTTWAASILTSGHSASSSGLPGAADEAAAPQRAEDASRDAPHARSATARKRSTAVSNAGSSSSSTAPSRFLACVRCPSANSRREASIPGEAVTSDSSATGRGAHGTPAPVGAMASAPIPSVLATPGNMSPAPLHREAREVGHLHAGGLHPRHGQRADVAPLVHDDERARAGPGQDPVDSVRPVRDLDVERGLPGGPHGAGPMRRLADVYPEVDATFSIHVVSSSQSAGQAVPRFRHPHYEAVANPARHVSISRPPRALRRRWQHPPPAFGRGRDEGPSGGGWPTTPQGQRNRTGNPGWGCANCNG